MAAKKTTSKKKGRIRRPNLMGETPADKKPTEKKAAPAKKPKSEKAPKKPRAKTGHTAGATITKAFKGATYTVQTTATGYTFKGVEYRSLTAIAKAITKYPAVSGPRFFGTDGKAGAK